MLDFIELFPNRLMMQVLGDDVIYIAKNSTGVEIKAMVNYAIQKAFAQNSYVPENMLTIDALKGDVPNIGKGAQFIHNGKTFVVDAIIDDDGVFVQLVVR